MQIVKVGRRFRYAIGGVHVVTYQPGEYEIGTGRGQIHPDAAECALRESWAEKPRKRAAQGGKASADDAGEGAEK